MRLTFATALVLDRNEEALAQYEVVLRREPGNLEAELGRAGVDLRLGRLDEAEPHPEPALRPPELSRTAHGLEGELFLRSRRAAEAELSFGVARDLDPWNTGTGSASRTAGPRRRTSQARAPSREALCLDPWADVRSSCLASTRSRFRRFRFDAGLQFDRDGTPDDWSQETAHLAWKAAAAHARRGDRRLPALGEDDAGRGRRRLARGRRRTLSSAYTYGRRAVVVARSAVDAEVARRVGRDASAILHWRHAVYAAGVRTDRSPGDRVPLRGEQRLLLRYYFVDGSETDDGHARSLRLELFPEVRSARNRRRLRQRVLPRGLGPAGGRTSDVLTVFAGVEWFCSKRTRLSSATTTRTTGNPRTSRASPSGSRWSSDRAPRDVDSWIGPCALRALVLVVSCASASWSARGRDGDRAARGAPAAALLARLRAIGNVDGARLRRASCPSTCGSSAAS